MATQSRSSKIKALQSALRKKYRDLPKEPEYPVMQTLLYAACLENAPMDKAEEAFASLEHNYFDWNEVRVTSVEELCEVLSTLPDPSAAAERIRKTLHAVFEKLYVFDLEEIRKKNLGQAVEELCRYDGVTPFMCSYATQHVLSGHSIPLDDAAMRVFQLLGLSTKKKTGEEVVTGLERAIPKSKGQEFSRHLHQFATELEADPNDKKLVSLLTSIDPKAEQRWKDRCTEKAREEESSEEAEPRKTARPEKKTKPPSEARSAEESGRRKKSKTPEPKEKEEKPPAKSTAKKKSTKHAEETVEDTSPARKKTKKKKKTSGTKKSKSPSTEKKKVTKSTKKASPRKKTTKKKTKKSSGKSGEGNRRSTTTKLSRKKPR
jgi:endonuclease-3